VTPEDLLRAASDLIARPDVATAGVWPRTAALLTRQALELSLITYWGDSPGTACLAAATMRSQLTCLPSYLDPATASQIAYTWAALSRACHYHPYELAPTAPELSRWINDVTALIAAVG
jgi:hypothetical protein